MRALARVYIAVSLLGAVHAVRRGRPARFAGLRFPGTPFAHALTVGTPLSAPPAMLAALTIAVRKNHVGATRMLSFLFLVGILAEPDSWAALRQPKADPSATGWTVLDAALPIALFTKAR